MERLESFTIGGGRGRSGKYPWDVWLIPGKVVRIQRGVDFDKSVNDMRVHLYAQAKKRNFAIETRTSGDAIEFLLVAMPKDVDSKAPSRLIDERS